jgi:hypothetical protein
VQDALLLAPEGRDLRDRELQTSTRDVLVVVREVVPILTTSDQTVYGRSLKILINRCG